MLKLYDFPYSPNSRKVRAVAYELGIPLEHVHVDLLRGEQRTPAYLAINPNGRVPVLVDGDLVLWESHAIIAYLAAAHGGGALMPAQPRERAEVERWLFWLSCHLGPALSKVAFERIVKKLTGQGPPDQAAIDAGTAEFARLTAILDGAFGDREHVAGRLSIADFALAAHYSLAPACGLDLAVYPQVQAWLSRMLARDGMKRALADADAV